jgi:hypothetical protein
VTALCRASQARTTPGRIVHCSNQTYWRCR